jgi:ABC-type polysaccharide transport system permease subunit
MMAGALVKDTGLNSVIYLKISNVFVNRAVEAAVMNGAVV